MTRDREAVKLFRWNQAGKGCLVIGMICTALLAAGPASADMIISKGELFPGAFTLLSQKDATPVSLSQALGLPLYEVNLSAIISKYVGETEENLQRVFSAAEQAGAILFFDEGDALFGENSVIIRADDLRSQQGLLSLVRFMDIYSGLTILDLGPHELDPSEPFYSEITLQVVDTARPVPEPSMLFLVGLGFVGSAVLKGVRPGASGTGEIP